MNSTSSSQVKLNAKELRNSKPTPEEFRRLAKNPIYIVLDNVLDTYNIGAIFRLAEAVAAEKVIICGESETPPNHRIKKASINTTEWVNWSYAPSTKEALQELRIKNEELRIVAIEQDARSVPYDEFDYSLPIALAVGHETTGISKEVLDLCDAVVEIPMFGVNISLNVMVSLGIVLYEVIERVKK